MHRRAHQSCSHLWTLWLLALFCCHQPSAASRVPGSQVLPLEGPPLVGQDASGLSDNRLLEQQPSLQPAWLTTSAEIEDPWPEAAASSYYSPHARSLLTGETPLAVSYSNASAVCPGSNGNWAAISGFGHQVSDNWLCSNRPTSPLHGASAQDFTDRPTWNTYGWAAFQVPARPTGSPLDNARVEGLNLLLLGNQGKGSSGNCSFSTIEIAIYTDASNAPGTQVYGARLRLGQAGKNNSRSFRYWGNYSSVISMDIVDKSGANSSSNPPAVLLDYSTVYWLRVQVATAYGAAKCFVSWVVNSQVKVSGHRALWQEATGGAGGYSTSCTGAAVNTLPAATQTLYSCMNGGMPNTGLIRRCLTFRNTVVNPLTCPAAFNDFSFSLWGNNAVECASKPTLALSNGLWPDACAGKKVYELCRANCTWGPTPGSASTECLVTGEWSTTITGQCEDPPTNCTASPERALTDGAWSSACAGTTIDANCTANCTWGPAAGQSPTAVCQSVPYGYPNITAWSITGECYDPPTNCSSYPWEFSSVSNWPSSCYGKDIGQNCTADCAWGASASGPPVSTCALVPYAYPESYSNWTASTGECNPEPNNCSAGPSDSLLTNYGTWESGCAGRAIGATCTATCPGDAPGAPGSMTVTCEKVPGQPDGQYNTTSLGTCNPVSCSGTPSAPLTNNGSWPSECNGTAAEGLCTATCPGGGNATSKCEGPTANWNSTVEGACLPQCSSTPTAPLAGPGSWGGCTGAFNISQTCNATCTYGGSAMVTCESNGTWSSTAEGKCLAQCTGAPADSLTNTGSPADSWGTCNTSLEGTVCSATCAGDGAGTPVNTTCGSDGQWGATVGACPRICPDNPDGTVNTTGSANWETGCADSVAGVNCTATCNADNTTRTTTCGSGGQWGAISAACPVVTCGDPSAQTSPVTNPPSGNYTWDAGCGAAIEGADCTVTCDTGGPPPDAFNTTCQSDGTWSATNATCP